MKFLVILLFAPAVFGTFNCARDNCLPQDDCVCASDLSPLNPTDTPQFILLTFDDTITLPIYEQLTPMLSRKNPDGNPISATFYIHHEYTDYELVNKLYGNGFEIASHTITNNYSIEYWRQSSIENLVSEFNGQRQVISSLANIPIEDIKGARMPLLELVGDKTIEAYIQSGISFDGSWASPSHEKLFPYTLDHHSEQQCFIGQCPSGVFPKFWINPINNMQNQEGYECNNLIACQTKGTVNEVYEWLIREFRKSYNGNRAPFKLLVNYAWFSHSQENYLGLLQFLDYANSLNDVYAVSESQAIEWRKNPVDVNHYSSAKTTKSTTCQAFTCEVYKGKELKMLRACNKCPVVYPWLGNPLGDSILVNA